MSKLGKNEVKLSQMPKNKDKKKTEISTYFDLFSNR